MTQDPPVVCILTAGLGTRMGPLADVTNKALLPIHGKAILSHLFALFPEGTNFVVGTGFKEELVRDYVALMHPDLKVTFCRVDPYCGQGSGPGYSLYCCREHLDRPFFFLPADGLYEFDPAGWRDGNRVGVTYVSEAQTVDYCNFAVDGAGQVKEVINKRLAKDTQAFTGLMHIHDVEAFWAALEGNLGRDGEIEIVDGLDVLTRDHSLAAFACNWKDLGTIERYRAALADAEAFDFSKTNEFIYFSGDKVVKFFTDPTIIADRVAKAAINPEVFPTILGVRPNMYLYHRAPGNTLYQSLTPAIFRRLLAWLNAEMWTRRPGIAIDQLCQSFYHDKTMGRLAQYARKYPGLGPLSSVNGTAVPTLDTLLEAVPWDRLKQGIASFIHGDLQFDNILWDGERFVLLDWRQDFAGSVEAGDLYYDLAKILGGIVLNYDYVKAGLLTHYRQGDAAEVDFAQRFRAREYEAILEDWVVSHGYDFQRVRILKGLIYLNMAPLHQPPFDQALLALGTLALSQALEGG